MEQAMESPHALDGRNCRALVGKARFSYFIDVCNSCSCNTPDSCPADCALRCVTPRSSVPVSVRRFGNQPLVTARTTFARTNQMNNYIVPSPSHPASCASVVCDGGARRQHATPLNRRFKTWRRLAPPPHVRSLVHRNSHTTTLGLISLHPCCWPRSATPDT